MILKKTAIKILNPFLKNGIVDIRGKKIIHGFIPPLPSYAGMKALSAILKRKILKKNVLTKAAIGLTSECQCKCVHCFYSKYSNKDKNEVKIDQIKSTIGEAISMGAYFIYLEGGEPLLHKNILDLVHFVQNLRAMPIILTNGIGLTQSLVEKLKESGLVEITVSIDAPNQETHDEFRGLKGCFDKAIEGLKLCVNAGLITGINTYATKENILNGELEEIIKLGYSISVDKIRIIEVIPSGQLLDHESVMLTEDDKSKLQEIVDRYQNRKPPIVFRYKKPENLCEAIHQCLHITPYGDVLPCGFMPIKFGSITDKPLKKIWEKMLKSPIGKTKVKYCWMQEEDFRKKYIRPIYDTNEFPIPYERIELMER